MSRARERLLARARQELPEPGDPRRLMADLGEQGLAGPEALEILSRTSLAWMQLRDLRLERAWSGGFGWFLARNLIVLGVLTAPLALSLHPPPGVLEAFLAGAASYYLLVLALSPLRLRRHARRRSAILEAYRRDLDAYLQSLPA